MPSRIDIIIGLEKFVGRTSLPLNRGLFSGVLCDLLLYIALLFHRHMLVVRGLAPPTKAKEAEASRKRRSSMASVVTESMKSFGALPARRVSTAPAPSSRSDGSDDDSGPSKPLLSRTPSRSLSEARRRWKTAATHIYQSGPPPEAALRPWEEVREVDCCGVTSGADLTNSYHTARRVFAAFFVVGTFVFTAVVEKRSLGLGFLIAAIVAAAAWVLTLCLTFRAAERRRQKEIRNRERLRLTRQESVSAGEPPREIEVSGAGSPMADGTYVLTTNERDGAPVYARDGGKWRLLRMQISGSAHWLVVDGANRTVYRCRSELPTPPCGRASAGRLAPTARDRCRPSRRCYGTRG